ncbi:MAG: hypothetical protein ACR2MO_13715 [Acidimicrobiales bacterium]
MEPAPPAEPVAKKAAKKAAKTVQKAARGGAPGEPGAPPTKRVRKARRQPWVEPLGNDPPTSYPVKAKLSSMLYHLPGMAFYDRTRPDRCYIDAEAAEADGFRRSKR